MSIPHTTGPWIVPLDAPYDRDRPTYFLEDAVGHQLMLLARLPEVGPEQHAANARLIAAAPDLLAAVEQFMVDGHVKTCLAPTGGKACSPRCAKARAAIAKARGES